MLKRVCRATFLLVIAAALILPFLGYAEVFQVSEGREGVVVNSILESNEYVLPLRHAETVPSKPPLFHWLSSVVYRHLHASPEFQLRAVSALSALGLFLTIILFLEFVAGGAAAVLGAGILLSTEGFLRMTADGRVDMLCCFLVSAAILKWLRAYLAVFAGKYTLENIPSNIYVRVAILCGLAVLAKGPIGLLLPLLIFSVLVTLDFGVRSLKVLIRPAWLWAGVVSLPWYIAAAWKGRTAFVARQVVFENFHRFFGGEGISEKPFWFYFEQIWAHAAPWSVVLTIYVAVLATEYYRRKKSPLYQSAFWPQNPTHRLVMKRSAIWALTLFIFFSLSAGKRSAYLLMVLPPLTIFLSLAAVAGFDRLNIFLRAAEKPKLLSRTFISGVALWLSAGIIGAAFWSMRMYSPDAARLPLSSGMMRTVRAMFDATIGWERPLEGYFLGLLFVSGAFWLIAFRKRSFPLVLAAAFFYFQLIDVIFINTALAGKGKTHGYKQLAADVAAAVPTSEQLTFIKKKHDESFDGFFFYLRRTVKLFEPSGALDGNGVPKEAGLYLARKGWIDEQPDRFTSRVEPLHQGGRRVDAPEREVVLFRLKEGGSPEIQSEPNAVSPQSTPGTPPLAEPSDVEDSE